MSLVLSQVHLTDLRDQWTYAVLGIGALSTRSSLLLRITVIIIIIIVIVREAKSNGNNPPKIVCWRVV